MPRDVGPPEIRCGSCFRGRRPFARRPDPQHVPWCAPLNRSLVPVLGPRPWSAPLVRALGPRPWSAPLVRALGSAPLVPRPWFRALGSAPLVPRPWFRALGSAPLVPRLRHQTEGCISRRMPRMQVYLPESMYEQVKSRGLPVSELLQRAVAAEVRRQDLLAETDRYLKDLVAEVGEPTSVQRNRAGNIARRAARRTTRRAG